MEATTGRRLLRRKSFAISAANGSVDVLRSGHEMTPREDSVGAAGVPHDEEVLGRDPLRDRVHHDCRNVSAG